MRRPTLKDIAAKTGYSVNTVSRALRNMPDISLETCEKIREMARNIGYYNNALASSLRLGVSKTIAIVIPDISNLFFAVAMLEIENEARKRGYSAILLNTSESGEFERDAIKTALQKNVDGIIFGPAQNSLDNTRMLLDSGTPFVMFARYFESLHTDYVVADDRLGGYQATMHLIEKGHRNILLLNGLSSQNSSAQGREAGYTLAHENAGLPLQRELMREVSIIGTESSKVLEAMLARRSDITAVFAYSDLVAFSAIDFMNRNGIRVPHDISLVGYDHIQGHISIPYPLTSVDNKIHQMACAALEALMQKLESGDSRQVICKKKIPTELSLGITVRQLHSP